MIGNVMDYMHWEVDNDGSQYLYENRDVKLFRCESQAIQVILDNYSHETEQGLYIKHNRIFFTLNGVKYWDKPTNSDIEWDTIGSLIKKLEPLCDNIAYYPGQLD